MALDVIHRLNSITEAIISTSNIIAATKYIMSLQGLDILPISREPFSPLTEAQKAHVKAVYEKAFK